MHVPADPAVRAGGRQSELARRIASALVMIPLGLGLLALGGPPWDALILVLAAGAAFEWAGMSRAGPAATGTLMAGAALVALLLGLGSGRTGWPILVLLVLALWAWRGRSVAIGLPYVAGPAAALIWLRAPGHGGAPLVLFVMLIVWSSDTGAYVTGRRFGGPKLAPALSPSKTWSGSAGGLLATALVGALFASLAPRPPLGAGSSAASAIVLCAIGAMVLGIAAQAGDLLESAAKRRFGVKDSGRLIPGHGGVLDRMDGLMAAALVACLAVLCGIG